MVTVCESVSTAASDAPKRAQPIPLCGAASAPPPYSIRTLAGSAAQAVVPYSKPPSLRTLTGLPRAFPLPFMTVRVSGAAGAVSSAPQAVSDSKTAGRTPKRRVRFKTEAGRGMVVIPFGLWE